MSRQRQCLLHRDARPTTTVRVAIPDRLLAAPDGAGAAASEHATRGAVQPDAGMSCAIDAGAASGIGGTMVPARAGAAVGSGARSGV